MLKTWFTAFMTVLLVAGLACIVACDGDSGGTAGDDTTPAPEPTVVGTWSWSSAQISGPLIPGGGPLTVTPGTIGLLGFGGLDIDLVIDADGTYAAVVQLPAIPGYTAGGTVNLGGTWVDNGDGTTTVTLTSASGPPDLPIADVLAGAVPVTLPFTVDATTLTLTAPEGLIDGVTNGEITGYSGSLTLTRQ